MRSLIPLAAVLGLGAGCASKADLDALSAKVAALQKKVDALDSRAAASAAPTAEDERAALQLLTQAQKQSVQGNYAEAKASLSKLLKRYGRTKAAARAPRMLNELGVVGKPAPALAATKWFQGSASDIDLSSGVTVLVFWEQWCPHCKHEVPKLEQTYTKYRGRMQFLGLTKVTRSATDEKVAAFIKEHGLEFPIAKEDGSMSQAFAVSGVPAAAVVKDGSVVWRGHPAQLTEAKLDGFLSN